MRIKKKEDNGKWKKTKTRRPDRKKARKGNNERIEMKKT